MPRLKIEIELIDNEDPTDTPENSADAVKQVLRDELSNYSFEIEKLEVTPISED